jgi:hypothetical protein
VVVTETGVNKRNPEENDTCRWIGTIRKNTATSNTNDVQCCKQRKFGRITAHCFACSTEGLAQRFCRNVQLAKHSVQFVELFRQTFVLA